MIATQERALIDAATDGDDSGVHTALSAGANIHALDDLALRRAAFRGHEAVVRLLLEHGANLHACNDLALRQAVFAGHESIARLLLEWGANACKLDDWVLRWAAAKGYASLVAQLSSARNLPSHNSGRPTSKAASLRDMLQDTDIMAGLVVMLDTLATNGRSDHDLHIEEALCGLSQLAYKGGLL